jgi:hypothetical protein
MKKYALACLVVLSLTVPASAAISRDGDGDRIISRIIRILSRVVRAFDDYPVIPPH